MQLITRQFSAACLLCPPYGLQEIFAKPRPQRS
jgi:hypothetical protein